MILKILTEHITTLDGIFKIIEDDSINEHQISENILKLISYTVSQ